MATIKSALSLYDGMSAPLKNIHTALNIVLNSFEAVQDASGNVIDTSAIQEAREELARAGSQLDQMEQNIREAEQAQDQFNGSVREGANAADSLGSKLKGILATVVSIAGVKSALGWAQENMKLADTQRNAENQLKAVLANMGVEDIEIPVTVDTGDAVKTLNNIENNLEALNSPQVIVDTSNAINALNRFNRVSNRLDGSAIDTTLNLDNGEAMQAAMEYDDWANRTDGNTIQNTLLLNGPDQPGNMEAALALNTGGAVAAYDDFVNTVDGNTITATVAVDNSQAISAYDAITAKASEIQGRGIYGDEAMIAGAAEFATYFSDAEAIMSMMDTLSNYAMGMTGGGAIDATAMVDYATNLGKIMTGAYDAMTKKGFEFTDAQKAVIEGTATHAQYVEALGEDYQSMSEDMRAATVINSIIAESWDGLYEAMSNTPEGKIIQFQNRFGDLREVLGNRVYPAALQFFDVFERHFPQIEQLLTVFSDGVSGLIIVLTWIAEAALNVASVIVDNWGWIGPIIGGVAAALLVYYGAQLAVNTITGISTALLHAHAFAEQVKAASTMMATGATFAETSAQYGLNAALYACPIMWIVMLVIALVAVFYAAVAAVNKFAGTSVSATGIICGAFMAALAFIGNLFVALWNIAVDVFVLIYNLVATVANFIGNVFTDPVGAVARLFFDLADTVLGVLQTLAGAIDAIFGSNLAGAVQGWRDSLGGWVDETFGKGEEVMEKMNADDMKLGRFEYGQAFDLGYKFGEGIEDTIGGLFKTPTLDEMGLDSLDAFNLGNTLDGVYGNTGDTAANTAAAADTLDYMDEDLAWMKDIAEREAINRYTTAEIKVEQHNENHISKDTDLDGVMEAFCFDFAEKLDVSAEGVHE
ncbi:hypothetical protein D1641_04250 [Colidextribacter sp. OB.20]|uniref:hypothetical protein n=1 Tax=Colidextribacter sp. OB.20 TaxID=2304568 RepID=UPI00136A166D|nr:hypothetical protein [Colidextribacter sp. OB.20]NBI09230.1 hypothetical protein [Colidextribacter sp. OB.20]